MRDLPPHPSLFRFANLFEAQANLVSRHVWSHAVAAKLTLMQYRFLGRIASAALVVSLVAAATPAPRYVTRAGSAAPVTVTVFKDPNCGCCRSWVEHLRRHGFSVVVHDTSEVNGAKRTGRVPEPLYACHTAFVNGYVIEGHVPAADIQRLLRDAPKIAGIAVAGMPVGSPGMEMGTASEHYDVVAFNRDGRTHVFARH